MITTSRSTLWLGTVLALTFLFSFTQPALAKGGTLYANADTGDDSNSCTSAAQPCKTLAGVKAVLVGLNNPKNTTIKLAGTFSEALEFDNLDDVTAPDTLDGLRITAIDPDNKPTITGPADSTVLQITNVNNLEVDHIIITGGATGVAVYGSVNNIVTNVQLHHLTITDLTTSNETFMYGIDVESTRDALIHHNTITNLSAVLTDATSYHYVQGIYSYNNYETTIHHNTIRTLSATNAADTVTSHASYVYGIYHYGGNNIRLRNNTIDSLTTATTATVAAASQTNITYGIYVQGVLDLTMKRNTITSLSAGGTATGAGSSITGQVIGMTLYLVRVYENDTNAIHHNTISQLSASSSGRTGTSTVRGFDIDNLEHAAVHHNTLSDFSADALSTEAVSSVRPTIYGFDGPTGSHDVIVRNNTLRDFTTSADYSVSGSSTSNVYGMSTANGHNITIQSNHLKSTNAMTVNNHDQATYNDSGTFTGISATGMSGAVIKRNTVSGLQSNYSSAGNDGYIYFNLFGIYTANTPGAQVSGNTVQHIEHTAHSGDITGATIIYNYSYGIYTYASANATLTNNTVTDYTIGATGSDGNYVVEQHNSIYIMESPNSVLRGNVVADITSTNGTGTSGSQNFYAIYAEADPQLILEQNVVRDITSSMTGSSSGSYLYGYTLKNSENAVANGNVFKDVTSTAANGHYVYGMNLIGDADGLQLFNNSILGKGNYDTSYAVGIAQASTSASAVKIYHNTVSDWFYALKLAGGSTVTIKNNILSSVGASSYPLAIAYNTVERSSFASNYNLFYNATNHDQIVYDTDAAAAIGFNDWTNRGGSWGYDWHSRKKNPKLKDNGHLKAGSPARRHGTTQYNVGVETDAATRLQYDIDGDARTSPTDSRVDIGADEFTS